MKQSGRISICATLLACALGPLTSSAQQTTAPSPLPDLIDKVRTYRYGGDRKALDAVEGLVNASLTNAARRASLAHDLAGILNTDAPYEAKQFVCRQLVLIADEREVPILARVVTGQDEALAHMALYALARIPSRAVNEALRRALDQTRGRSLIGVINTLGDRRDRRAVPRLAALLGAPEATSAAAAAALGKIGGKAATRALEKALDRVSDGLRTAVADALLSCAAGFVAEGNRSSAEAIYARFYRDASSPRLQAAALRGLASVRAEKALPEVLESLGEDGSPRQQMAVELVQEMAGSSTTKAVAGRMLQLSPAGQFLVLGALAQRGDQAARPAVESLCSSPDASVRLAALGALSALGNASSVRLLASRAAAGPADEREKARASLSRLRGQDINRAIIDALQGASPSVQVELIKALGQRGATEAVSTLLKTATSPDQTVRVTSWRELRGLSRFSDMPALVALLLESEPGDRNEAENAVATVARLGADESQQTGAVLARLADVGNPTDKSSLLRVLGQIGGARALAALRQAASDDHPEIRLTVTRLLADWPTDQPLDDLRATVRTTPDQRQRALALRGYVRLIGLNENRRPAEALPMYREAMALASNATEKRMVLAGLASLKSLASLEIAAEHLGDAELRQEAEVAALEIARGIGGAFRERTSTILQNLADTSPDGAMRKQARELRDLIHRFGDYITAWEVSPPYTKDDAMAQWLFSLPFPPEVPEEAKMVNWRIMPAGTNPEKPWLLDLLAFHGGEQRIAYLRTRVWSNQPQALVLELGSDDGVKVWLNGRVVHGNNVLRAIEPAQDKVPVNLERGWNQLLLKITQNNAGWGACARFSKPDGSAAEGLRFEVQ
jgi:HEAT repeat protein